jgi:hypothetical protein
MARKFKRLHLHVVPWHALVKRERHRVANAPLPAIAHIDIKPAGPLAIGCSRHVKRGRTVAARQNFKRTLGLFKEKGGKKRVDSREYALIILQKLLGGIAVKPFFSSHEMREFFLLPLRKPQILHAFQSHSGRDALYLSQANGVNLSSCVRHASVVLWKINGQQSREANLFSSCDFGGGK